MILVEQQFGQRELIALTLSLPYIATRFYPSQNKYYFGFFIGLFAAIGLCLKPYFLLPPILIELYWVIRTRSLKSLLRTDLLAMILFAIAYTTTAWLLSPLYFSKMLPLIKMAYLGVNHLKWSFLLNIPESYVLLFILVIYALGHHKLKHKSEFHILLLANMAFFLCYLIGGRYFFYHILPITVLNLLLLITFFIDRIFIIATGVLTVLNCYVCGYAIGLVVATRHDPSYLPNQLIQIADRYGANQNAFFMMQYNQVIQNLRFYSKAKFPGPLFRLWLLPKVNQLQHQPQTAKVKHELAQLRPAALTFTVDQLLKIKPKLIFYSNTYILYTYDLGQFNTPKYLSQDPRFKRFWQHYKLLTTVQRVAVYIRTSS